MIHHSKNGWFFHRLKNGMVAVEKRDGQKDTSPVMERGVFTAEEWASIVASVSSGGEVNDRWRKSLDFHME